MRVPFKIGLLVAVVVIVVDQITKVWALSALKLYEPVTVLPGLNMTLAYNQGVAFSMFDESGDTGRWLLSALAIVVSLFLIVWLWRLLQHERLLAVGLGFVLGGALGNVIDRIQLGHVIDFIDVYYQGAHWPAFNIADSAITLGAILLVWDTLFSKHESTDNKD